MPYRTSKATQKMKDEKREHIMQAAAHVFSGKGYRGTSVRDIIAEAGISTGSFYFYFRNKWELFEAIRSEATTLMFKVIRDTFEEDAPVFQNICRSIALVLHAIERNPELTRIVIIVSPGLGSNIPNHVAEYLGSFVGFTAELFASYKAQGSIRVDNPHTAALACTGAVFHTVIDWLNSDMAHPITEEAFALSRFILDGLNVAYEASAAERSITEALES
jgi:AcrR family transcriptional regulator